MKWGTRARHLIIFTPNPCCAWWSVCSPGYIISGRESRGIGVEGNGYCSLVEGQDILDLVETSLSTGHCDLKLLGSVVQACVDMVAPHVLSLSLELRE